MTKHYVYILALKQGKYYVGMTSDFWTRIDQHSRGDGAAWTTKYAPRTIYHIEPPFHDKKEAASKEDYLTKELMMAHGIDNVRGGGYSTVTLSPQMKNHLAFEIHMMRKTREDLCFVCSQNGHYARNCPRRKTRLSQTSSPCANSATASPMCKRCGRNSHTASSCYANTTVSGRFIHSSPTPQKQSSKRKRSPLCDSSDSLGLREDDDEEFGPLKKNAQAIVVMNATQTDDTSPTRDSGPPRRATKRRRSGCERCGRSNHTVENCFATTNVRGELLPRHESEGTIICPQCG